MHSAKTHPTPQYVIDAIHVIASWLREIEAVEVLISPQGGASWHGERQADRLLAGWQEAEACAASARDIILVLREGLDEDWMTTRKGREVIARTKRFLEDNNALS